VSLYPDHARDPAALLASADAAMYRVKREPQA
jgi:GGDEF domain-containing protein